MQFLWSVIAWIVTRSWLRTHLIARSMRTPYVHLPGYMHRWWLFNPYPSEMKGEPETRGWLMRRLPSIRIHHILRPDYDRDPHNHPWRARSIILTGWYVEKRPLLAYDEQVRIREAGDTYTLTPDDYHMIIRMNPIGVMTLFITWRKVQSWGFMTPEGHIPWRQYEAEKQADAEAEAEIADLIGQAHERAGA